MITSSKSRLNPPKKQAKNLRCGKKVIKSHLEGFVRPRKTPQLFNIPRPVNEFINNPKFFLNKYLPETSRRVYRQLLIYKHRYKCICPSQERIGNEIGLSREEVNRSLTPLLAYGLLKTKYRHMDSCVYVFPRIIDSRRLIKSVSSVLPELLLSVPYYLTQYNNLSISNNGLCINQSLYCINEQDNSQKEINRYRFYKLGPQMPNRTLSVAMQKKIKVINNISKNIDLTNYGKAALTQFCALALNAAHGDIIRAYKKGAKINDPFRYLYGIARKYSKNENVALDYTFFNEFKRIV